MVLKSLAARLLTAGKLENWLHVEFTVFLLTISGNCYAVQMFTQIWARCLISMGGGGGGGGRGGMLCYPYAYEYMY